MIVNYAFSRMLNLFKNHKSFCMPYFLLLLVLSMGETFFMGMGQDAAGLYLVGFFISILGVITQVSFFYALNYTYGLHKDDLTLSQSLWNGLCFTPGFVLAMLKYIFRVFFGLLLLIVPGLYWFFKHTLDPYYTLISEEGSPYRKSFMDKDLKEIVFLNIPFLIIGLMFPWAAVFKFRTLEYLQTPLSTLVLMATLASIYFYIDYLERVRTKS
jgi:hypothetical protein